MTDNIVKKNLSYTEAIAYANKRNIVLPDVYYGKLVGIQRSQAVSVAGLASIEQIRFVVDQLDKVLRDGKTFKDFQDAVKTNTLGIELPKHRLDNIFRTNIQGAYARGRWEQQERVKATRPYLMYDAINDGRTRPHHHAMDNTILPRDHPWWTTHYPPNGYRCRCTVISLTKAQADKRGGVKEPPDVEPDEGWGYNPGTSYLPPAKKAVEKAATKVKVAKPAATKAIEKAVKAIEEKAKPITLDSVLERGKKALAELGEEDYLTGPWTRRLEDMVLERVTGGKVRRDFDNRIPADAVAAHAKKHYTKGFHVRTSAPVSDEHFKEKVYARLPLPGSWLRAVSDWAINPVGIEYSAGRAWARQDQGLPVMSISHERGDVILHEFVHLVQVAKPEIQDMAREMHARRTAGAAQKKLADLFPHSGYEHHEVAKEDKYFAAYMGREYVTTTRMSNGSWKTQQDPLEILTMAIQALMGDVTAFGNSGHSLRRSMFRNDRETAEFALGLLLSYD